MSENNDLGRAASGQALAYDTFWSKVSVGRADQCWYWQRSLRRGYGVYWNGKKNVAAHRFAVVISGREIPDGMVVDHMCRNRSCVNPNHLRVVTNRTNLIENSAAAAAVGIQKTHCKRGHLLSGDNLRPNISGTRRCRQCDVTWTRAWRLKRKGMING